MESRKAILQNNKSRWGIEDNAKFLTWRLKKGLNEVYTQTWDLKCVLSKEVRKSILNEWGNREDIWESARP